MKRLLLISAVIISSLVAYAEVKQQIGFQIGSEGNLARLNTASDTALSLAHNLNGPTIGLAYEVDMYKGLSFYIAANYSFSTQLKKTDPNMLNNYQVSTLTNFHAISIPIHLQYRFLLAENTWISVYAGPLLQVGIKKQQIQTTENPINGLPVHKINGNQYRYVYDYYKIVENTELNKFSDADNDRRRDHNRFNPMLGIGLEFQFYQFYVRGGYNWGVANLYYDRTFTNLQDTSKEWLRRQRQDEWSVHFGWYFAYTR